MRLLALQQRMCIQGVMPERALLKLRRAKIALFDVKKTQKDRLEFVVAQKDIPKVFAIYPKVCYNNDTATPYTAQTLGAVGVMKYLSFFCKRVGFCLGALAFFALMLFADNFIFAVDFHGSAVYAREARIALAEYGIKPFCRYQSDNEDLICAKLLRLDGVEFCSVQKYGLRVRVEMRVNADKEQKVEWRDFTSRYQGEIIAITVLRGTQMKSVGDKVVVGETLVGGWLQSGEEKMRVAPIARASIACVYESVHYTADEESAFAQAYLSLGLDENGAVSQSKIEKTEQGYLVRIAYTVIESINF